MRLPLNIKDDETHRKAKQLAALTGESITEAVGRAVGERLRRIERRQALERRRLVDRLTEIARHCAALPVLDPRSAGEILGYDERGLPG